jgi:hypothetical protein
MKEEEKIKWIDRTNKEGIEPTRKLLKLYFNNNIAFEDRMTVKKVEILKVQNGSSTSGKIVTLKIISKPTIDEFDLGWFKKKKAKE